MVGKFPVAEGSKENATPVGSTEELPDQYYRVGYFEKEGDGESFQEVANSARKNSFFKNANFERVKHPYDEPLHVIGHQDTESYDVTALPASDHSNAGLSAAEQHAESRSTVENIHDNR